MEQHIIEAWQQAIPIDEDPEIIRFDKYDFEIEFYAFDTRSPYGWKMAR